MTSELPLVFPKENFNQLIEGGPDSDWEVYQDYILKEIGSQVETSKSVLGIIYGLSSEMIIGYGNLWSVYGIRFEKSFDQHSHLDGVKLIQLIETIKKHGRYSAHSINRHIIIEAIQLQFGKGQPITQEQIESMVLSPNNYLAVAVSKTLQFAQREYGELINN